jgi:NAD(P)-dependent dehydrogenase (short-subunit alcohol dehydrogenase family)
MASSDSRSAVLVAGGTGVLGRAVVRELLDHGHSVTATWRRSEERDRLAREVGEEPRLRLVEAELTDPEGAAAAVASVGDELGAVVDLVGGYAGGNKLGEAEPAELERMLTLNLRPLFLLARAAMPVLAAAGGGALVAVASRPALRPRGGDAAYAAAKASVLSLIRSLDVEYRDTGVRSNAIVPSVIDTPANRTAMPKADHSRWVAPVQVAQVVRFLVSDDSAAISGAAIPVYGRA